MFHKEIMFFTFVDKEEMIYIFFMFHIKKLILYKERMLFNFVEKEENIDQYRQNFILSNL